MTAGTDTGTEEYLGDGRRTTDIMTLAEDIIEHGDNIAYPSRSSSQYVRNVMRSLVEAYRDMESRALHAETVLAEHDAISESQDPPAKWLDAALRDLARELLADPKTTWIGERDPTQHICWTAADRLAALRDPVGGGKVP